MQGGSFFKPLIYPKTYYFLSDPKCVRQNNAVIAPLHTITDGAVRGDGGQDRRERACKLLGRCRRSEEWGEDANGASGRRVGMQRVMVLVLPCLMVCSVVDSDTKLQRSASEGCSSTSYCSSLPDYVCVQKHVHDFKSTHSALFLFLPENLMVWTQPAEHTSGRNWPPKCLDVCVCARICSPAS